MKHILQVSDVLLEGALSLVEFLVSLIKTNIVGSLPSSSSCLSALGCMMSSDTTGVAHLSELTLRLSSQSKGEQAVVDVHDIEGSLRHLPRGRGIRCRGKGVCGSSSSMDILIGSTHLSKTSNKSLIRKQLSILLNHLLNC